MLKRCSSATPKTRVHLPIKCPIKSAIAMREERRSMAKVQIRPSLSANTEEELLEEQRRFLAERDRRRGTSTEEELSDVEGPSAVEGSDPSLFPNTVPERDIVSLLPFYPPSHRTAPFPEARHRLMAPNVRYTNVLSEGSEPVSSSIPKPSQQARGQNGSTTGGSTTGGSTRGAPYDSIHEENTKMKFIRSR